MKATMKPAPVPSPDAWLSPSDLDEDVAKRVRQMAERFVGSGSAPDHLSDSDKKAFREAHHGLAWRRKSNVLEDIHVGLGCLTAALIVFALFCVFHSYTHEAVLRDVLLSVVLVALSISAQIALAFWQRYTKRKKAALPQTVGFALRFLNHKTLLEKAYCEAVAALLQEPPTVWGGPQAARHLLHDLRDLFQVGKQTAARRAQIKQAMSHQSVAEVDAEAARLTQRVLAASDDEARAMLEQSFAHLEARRARVRAMEPLRERLEAQEEAVYQALREAQTTLSSPVWISETTNRHTGDSVMASAAHSWSETATRLHLQTHAVEAAVQEVMQVGVGKSGA